VATSTKKTHAAMERELARSQADEIARAQIVRGSAKANQPISIRLSAPLLERLDRVAAKQDRKRGNLIQHILWEYVRAHADD